MKLPFGIPSIKEITLKNRDDSAEIAAFYESRLEEYKEALENYKTCLLEYAFKLNRYNDRKEDNHISLAQNALDLSYVKEQCDKTIRLLEEWKTSQVNNPELLENMTIALSDINLKLEGLDKNVVNRLSELMLELQKQILFQNKQLHAELTNGLEQLQRTVRRGQGLYIANIILSIFGLSGLAFLILYILEVIPF